MTTTTPIILTSQNYNRGSELMATFSGKTTYLSTITGDQLWDFTLNSDEIIASKLCLEIYDKAGKQLAYNSTNTCHTMANNKLQNILMIPGRPNKDDYYIFSVLLATNLVEGRTRWDIDRCLTISQVQPDFSIITTYVGLVGGQTLGSPGVILSLPLFRKASRRAAMFEMTIYGTHDSHFPVKLKYTWLGGVLSSLQLYHKNLSDENTYICYANQLPIRAKLSTFEGDSSSSGPYIEFIDTVLIFRGRTTAIACPDLEVVGNYVNVDPVLSGLAFLGSVYTTCLIEDQSLTFDDYSSLPCAEDDPEGCVQASKTPVAGYVPHHYLSSDVLLTLGSSQNETVPLIALKNSPVSPYDTTVTFMMILDLRGFENDNMATQQSNQDDVVGHLDTLYYTPPTTDIVMSHLFSLQRSVPSHHHNPHASNQIFPSPLHHIKLRDTKGPVLKCYTTGYRLDRISLNTTLVYPNSTQSQLSNISIFSSSLNEIYLNDLGITADLYTEHPQYRYQIIFSASRVTDIDFSQDNVEVQCTLESSYGPQRTVYSHAKIYPPLTNVTSATPLPPQHNAPVFISWERDYNHFNQLRYNITLLQPQDDQEINALRMVMYGIHRFGGAMTQCRLYAFDANNNILPPPQDNNDSDDEINFIPFVISVTGVTELTAPFELDPAIPIPDFPTPRDSADIISPVVIFYTERSVKRSDYPPNLLGYNITCIDGFIYAFDAKKINTTSVLRVENLLNPTAPDSAIIGLQNILLAVKNSPAPTPPPPDRETTEDNLVLVLVLLIIFLVVTVACITLLIRLKKLRDKKRQELIEQQQMLNNAIIDPTFNEYPYQIIH